MQQAERSRQKAERRRPKAEAPLPPQAAAHAAQSQIANRKSQILLAVLLALVTLAVYWPATRCDFIEFDDPYYISGNPQVQGGLTWQSFKWAWVTPVADNWHPLTVLSHMLVCQVCGVKPWGHHLANVVLHALNAALVFAVLQRMTGARWRSLLVAGLFALHPLRLESVVWVSERKDVLSAFFGLLSLIAYARYAQGREKSEVRNPKSEGKPKSEPRSPKAEARGRWSLSHLPSSIFYLLSLFCYALGLMSKPMLVTWPFVMLLLDYWPLGRMQKAEGRTQNAASGDTQRVPRTTPHVSRFTFHVPLLLVLEKLPFFTLAALGSVATFLAQQHGVSLASGAGVPLGARVGNALISYCRQLGHEFWPTRLAVFYPHPGKWPLAQVLLAGGLVLVISVAAWVQRRRQPYLLVGWLWFVGMLVPVIGLVQSGGQAMADRHTYLPSLGLLLLVVWGAGELMQGKSEVRSPKSEDGDPQHAPRNTPHVSRTRVQSQFANRQSQILLWVAGSLAIIGCLGLTRHQLGYWQDGETLFRHALEVTGDNYVARNCLAVALLNKGQIADSITQSSQAIRLKPNDSLAYNNLGVALLRSGQTGEAIHQFQQALWLKPDYAEARKNLAVAFTVRGDAVPPPSPANKP